MKWLWAMALLLFSAWSSGAYAAVNEPTAGTIAQDAKPSEVFVEGRRINATCCDTTSGKPHLTACGDDSPAWIDLLQGELSDHWKTSGNWTKDAEGVVALTPRPGEQGWARFAAYLWSKEQFADFQIQFDYKIEADGNSGFYFHVGDEKSPVAKGIEVQISDSASFGSGHKLSDHDPGGLIPGIPPSALADKPAGEWNHFDITSKGDKMTVVLNGKTINVVDLNHPSIKDRARNGLIGFQDNARPTWLRNIRIRRL